MKVCIVCSAGGHLLQAVQLKSILTSHDTVWVSFPKEDACSLLKDDVVVWAYYPTQRNIYNLVRNFLLAFKIFRTRDIDIVISTGAGVGIPFIVLGRLLGKKTIFIESIARISELSLTGKVLYRFAHLFFVQWPELKEQYPRSIYAGRLL